MNALPKRYGLEQPQQLAPSIKLNRMLHEKGFTRAALQEHLTLDNGNRPSPSTVYLILRFNRWPSKKKAEGLRPQMIHFMRSNGFTEEEIAVAFELDDTPIDLRATRQDQAQSDQVTAPNVDIDEEVQLPENQMLTQAARKHFSLFRDPFQDDVQSADDIFLAPEQRYIREYMFSTAKQGGFLAVIGESGAGKSVLRRDLLDRIRRESHPVTCIMPRVIDKEKLTAAAICDAIICDISQEHPRRTLEAKARQIEKLLTGSSRSGNSHVLIIEEAHDVSIQTLKYLKRFWELEDGFRRLLSIILIGQPELKAKLDERQHWEAREVIRRIEVAELAPLNGHLEQYITLKFKRLGKESSDLFEDSAYGAIRERLTFRRRGDESISMVYPLVVNSLIVKAMNLAAEIGAKKIGADVVLAI